jgi:quinol monooxygenase YgiN
MTTTSAGGYTSGNWVVKEGNEQTFVEQWRSVARWCLQNSQGARSFRLIQDTNDPRHFISFGEWDDLEWLTVARGQSEFLRLFRGCQRLCDRFEGSDYVVALALPE